MEQTRTTGGEAQGKNQTTSRSVLVQGFDEQYAELIETVWACEREWRLDDRVDAAIRYGR